MGSLGAIIDTEKKEVSFRNLGLWDLRAVRTPAGHMGIYIDDFNKNTDYKYLMDIKDNGDEVSLGTR